MNRRDCRFAVAGFGVFSLFVGLGGLAAFPAAADEFEDTCRKGGGAHRTVCADIAAIEQPLVYNRFGSFDAFGMIFALTRDIRPIETFSPAAVVTPPAMPDCEAEIGTAARPDMATLSPGAVRLRDCKRPRPIVLRANVGDRLVIRVTNLLSKSTRDFSRDFCRNPRIGVYGRDSLFDGVETGDAALRAHGEADCLPWNDVAEGPEAEASTDWPATRGVNLVVQGLLPRPGDPDACRGTGSALPGGSFTCTYEVEREGTFFFASPAAPAGGEGDGGALVHGLFGAVLAERAGARVYRSQTSPTAFRMVQHDPAGPDDQRPNFNYEAIDANGVPILNMHRRIDLAPEDASEAVQAGFATPEAVQAGFAAAKAVEIVHSDLNAIVYCDPAILGNGCREGTGPGDAPTTEPGFDAFREFSVFFHDELKTSYTANFRELGQLGQLEGVKDGFAINYGASGMGSLLLANRKGIGPAAACMECLYEEFFLTSWANGDPALLEWYDDDPSNVHHSYLNDPVVFRNFHAGPKETHVFHLHAHQWFAGNDPSRGSYLDSQTVGPQQGFTYNIYHGGLRRDGQGGENRSEEDRYWDTQGSGNRNRTVGDSIFHCHLYPHFAQGMWALWRVHDVLEDGGRRLPDGQNHAGLSLEPFAGGEPRRGSVDPATGEQLAGGDAAGTPIPALIPLPGAPLPLEPSYALAEDVKDGALKPDAPTPMPGYPFYIAGQPGHRPPQAPLDIARNLGAPLKTVPGDDKDKKDARTPADAFPTAGTWLDGGLGRHVVASGSTRKLGAELPGVVADQARFDALDERQKRRALSQAVARAFALGDLSGHLTSARINVLDPYGSRLERAAMGFHSTGMLFDPALAQGAGRLRLKPMGKPEVVSDTPQSRPGGYETTLAATPGGYRRRLPEVFKINGSAPRPGAPFADPCGRPITKPNPGTDPLLHDWTGGINGRYQTDDRLSGFRRYEASAVQVDLVANRAGWHDPQGRINVLTVESDRYKEGPGRISPRISDSEEPFFFRALSGECIEFRHTNELPKELELDDFQVRTPTDTIGQHIHLVKFDVTSSDGSGNGWNYEDGTFAPDELAVRLCAWGKSDRPADADQAKAVLEGLAAKVRAAQAAGAGGPKLGAATAFCDWAAVAGHGIWRLKRSEYPFLFQTTVQRWFADPILAKDKDGQEVDRTMRTVFTHDHFGPSSIQQHGFYAGLLVEPNHRETPAGKSLEVCPPEQIDLNQGVGGPIMAQRCVRPLSAASAPAAVAWGGPAWEGARSLLRMPKDASFEHPSYREFALSIADFALLYDPRDTRPSSRMRAALADESGAAARKLPRLDGMARLACEARYRLSPTLLRDVCGLEPARDSGAWIFPGGPPPAWVAGGANRDDAHKAHYAAGDAITSAEARALADHLIDYRQKAAGGLRSVMARPVAAPERPEAISADHHDPYLVNYRGAPLPLRIGDKDGDRIQSWGCRLLGMNRAGETRWKSRPAGSTPEEQPSEVVRKLQLGDLGNCSIVHQIAGSQGDIGAAMTTGRWHEDPETPVLEAYQGERIMFRLIQGAQEVQHVFSVAGQSFKRNVDQNFPAGMQPLGQAGAYKSDPSRQERCRQRKVDHKLIDMGLSTDPAGYEKWLNTPSGWSDYWRGYQGALAECDNLEGYVAAQEIGISEHFEMRGALRADVNAPVEFLSMGMSAAIETDETSPTGSSDYRYDFGTVDALWNGAWGLLRIYKGEQDVDPNTDPKFNPRIADGMKVEIGSRMGKPASPNTESTALFTPDHLATSSGLSCPIGGNPPYGGAPQTLRVVEAVIVALEARAVFDPRGMVYAPGVHDPDGLFLALLSPAQAGGKDVGKKDDWEKIERAPLIAAVKKAYGWTYGETPRLEPFVLRVRAGDCLRIRVVNLLGDSDPKHDYAMKDHLGDAILPRIVPLNADPIPQDGHEPGSVEARLDRVDPGLRPGGLRPSELLGLTFTIPGIELIRQTPLGYGYNRPGLEADTASELLTFYAGRFRIAPPAEGVSIGDTLADKAKEAFQAALADDSRFAGLLAQTTGGKEAFEIIKRQDTPSPEERAVLPSILGVSYDVTIDGEIPSQPDPALRALAQKPLEKALSDHTHWIPYAFGALPIRPSADVISQGTHGLFGAIDVVPANWNPLDEAKLGLTCDDARDGFQRCEAFHVPGRGDGDPMVWTVEDADGKTERIREFVLFVQDGLNLWDESSSLTWIWDDDTPVIEDRAPVHMVPDCPVCDDSYDRGEKAVSYRSPALSRLLRRELDRPIEERDDLNAHVFPQDWPLREHAAPRLVACEPRENAKSGDGEQIVIRVVHPGGRARQHAFVMNGYTYDDLFPGFGFPRSALLAPGKAVSAWLRPDAAVGGPVLWHDGPTPLRSGGIWGLLDVQPWNAAACGGK